MTKTTRIKARKHAWKGVLKKEWSSYVSSIRSLKDYGNVSRIIIYDILFLILLFFVSVFFSLVAKLFKFISYVSFMGLIVILLFMGFFLSVVAVWSISRGLIWSRILKKEFTSGYFLRLFSANVAWIVLWIIPVFLAMYSYSLSIRSETGIYLPEISFVLINLLMLLLLHFTAIMYCGITLGKNIRSAIAASFVAGTLKIRKFLAPYLFAALTLIAVSAISMLLVFLTAPVQQLISGIMFFVYLAWIRIYIVPVIKENL